MAPQSRRPVILLTRPAVGSSRFAAALLARLPGTRVVTSPLLAPSFLTPQLPGRDWAGLILTSETAAESARRITADGTLLPSLAFCVGDRTAEAARALGLTPVSAKGDAEALIALILGHGSKGPLLHLHGRDTRGNIAGRLNSAGIETHSVIAYVQSQQSLSVEATELLASDNPVLAPLFSPRSAEILAAELAGRHLSPTLTIVALSPAVAKAAQQLNAEVQIAARPDAPAMLDATTRAATLAGGA